MALREKIKKGLTYVGYAIGSGILTTLISEFYVQERITLPGATTYSCGFPEVWLKKVAIVYRGNPVKRYLLPGGFFKDVAYWSLLIGIPVSASIAFYKWYKSRK